MQYQQLKKRLLMESGIIGGALAALSAVIFILGYVSDDYQKSSQDLENKVNSIAATTSSLSAKFDNVRHNEALFKEIMQLQAEHGFTITPQIATDRFNTLRDKYYLSDLHLSMSPITEMQASGYKRATNVTTSSEVDISFEGLSDEYAYGLLEALQNELPGSCKITSVTLTREHDVTKDFLHTISKNGAAPLIRGEVKFVWLGIKPVETSNAADARKTP